MKENQRTRSVRLALVEARRVVVKVGSGVLVGPDYHLDESRVAAFVSSVSALLKERQVVVVSSGAIAAGAPIMGLENRARTIPENQACAAVGQSRLMAMYERLFSLHGHHTAQILLTQDDVRHRRRYLYAKNTLETLLSGRIVPIVNENDTVVVEEIKFGENDNLAAQVAALVQADLLLLLSSVAGFYEKDPSQVTEDDTPISVVERITDAHFSYARDRMSSSSITSGGMRSKLMAIRKAAQYGIPSVLATGLKRNTIERVLSGREEGTLFLPEENKLSARKHWILHSLTTQGSLYIDTGAVRALVEQKRSLLPIGITRVEGEFGSGASVRVVSPDDQEIACGLTHYNSKELEVIRGARSEKIESLLGYSYYDEVIHRDNLVLLR